MTPPSFLHLLFLGDQGWALDCSPVSPPAWMLVIQFRAGTDSNLSSSPALRASA